MSRCASGLSSDCVSCWPWRSTRDRKSTRLNSSHSQISYAVFCLKKKHKQPTVGDTDQVPEQTPLQLTEHSAIRTHEHEARAQPELLHRSDPSGAPPRALLPRLPQ